jgi:N-acyl homoserine lactone hydrolase
MSRWKKHLFLLALLFSAGVAFAAPPAIKTQAVKPAAPAADNDIKLYALDCGHMDFKSLGMFSDTGELDGRSGRLVAPCFLIRHPSGWLLWEAGLGDDIAGEKNGVDLLDGLLHEEVPVTLAAQLKQLGIAPKNIDFVAFSNLREDHVGNANLFSGDTWILSAKELAWATSQPTPVRVDPSLFADEGTDDMRQTDGDYDVFGDGRVVILKAPGGTPGHQVLLLRLKKAGAVLLTGDLYPLRESRGQRRVPSINTSRAETLASMERIERIAANLKARVVVESDPADFAALPKFPAWLD